MPGLRVVTTNPPNAGVELSSLTGSVSQAEIFERNNFPIPESPPTSFTIRIAGADDRSVSLDDLRAFPQATHRWMLECAGNARTGMQPKPVGTPWPLAAMSPVNATGVRLRDVVGALAESVSELVFTGADRGRVPADGAIGYQFSLPRAEAMGDEPLLVTELNGEPLSVRHGGPIRLMVPGGYGMKSVKWLEAIHSVEEPFEGHFVRKYRYRGDPRFADESPVDRMLVRAVITSHVDDEALVPGPNTITGAAWSGADVIASVAISGDDGTAWVDADLTTDGDITWWEAEVGLVPGAVLVARATDASGATQPLEAPWNKGGYGNNAVHRVVLGATP